LTRRRAVFRLSIACRAVSPVPGLSLLN
jgi:hypothetical protein